MAQNESDDDIRTGPDPLPWAAQLCDKPAQEACDLWSFGPGHGSLSGADLSIQNDWYRRSLQKRANEHSSKPKQLMNLRGVFVIRLDSRSFKRQAGLRTAPDGLPGEPTAVATAESETHRTNPTAVPTRSDHDSRGARKGPPIAADHSPRILVDGRLSRYHQMF